MNCRNVENEVGIVNEALKEIGGEIIEIIPRDPLVQQSENMGKTVIEAFPESKLAGTYTKLAEKIAALCGGEEK